MIVKFSKKLERLNKIKLIGDFKVKIKFNGLQFYFWLNAKDIIDYSNLTDRDLKPKYGLYSKLDAEVIK